MRRVQKRPFGYWKELNKRRTAYRRAYYQANRAKIIADKKSWVERHKEYHEAYCQTYRETHREVMRERSKAWREKNPHQVVAQAVVRRKRLRGNSINDLGILEFYRLARSKKPKKCYYCSRIFRGVADVDHIVPITRGGSHSSSNLCISCPSCNRQKFTKLPSEFVSSGQLSFDL